MSLQDQITNDWKKALKEKSSKKEALSMIMTELKNRAIKDNVVIDGKRVVEDNIAVEVMQKMAKQRKEAIESYQSAGRDDLASKEQVELSVISEYLPAQLNDEELKSLVSESIAKSGATSLKEMGAVMALVIKKVSGRADGKRIQQMVRSLLG